MDVFQGGSNAHGGDGRAPSTKSLTAAPATDGSLVATPLSILREDKIQRLHELLDHGVLPTEDVIETAIEASKHLLSASDALAYLKRAYVHLESIRSEKEGSHTLCTQIKERISSLADGTGQLSDIAKSILRTIAPELLFTRNVGIIAHVDAGKTTLSDRIFVAAGIKPDFGSVEGGTTITDALDEEKKHGMSIVAVAKAIEWNGYDQPLHVRRINLVDTPGHFELQSEVRRSLSVLSGAVVVIDAKKGVEINTRTAWRHADNFHLPRVCFFNKLDELNAEPEIAWHSLKKFLSTQTPASDPVPLQWPIYRDNKLFGIVDLINLKVHHADGKVLGTGELNELNDAERRVIESWRENLCLTIAAQCPELEDLVMGGSDISREQIDSVVRARTLSGTIVPVLFGSAFTNLGVHSLLDAVSKYLPSESDPKVVETDSGSFTINPDPIAPVMAYAFGQSGLGADALTWLRVFSGNVKTGTTFRNRRNDEETIIGKVSHLANSVNGAPVTAQPGAIITVHNLPNVQIGDTLVAPSGTKTRLKSLGIPPPLVLYNIEPTKADDRARFLHTLKEFARSDAALTVKEELGKVVIGGSGELHLQISLERFRRLTDIEAKLSEPEVRYVGRITRPNRLFLNRHFGPVEHRVDLEVVPAKPGEGFSISFDGVRLEQPANKQEFDKRFFNSVRKGVLEALQQQVALNAPTMDVRVSIRELVFKFGGNIDEAFYRTSAECAREACRKAGLELLEPVMEIHVYCSDKESHAVQADLMRRQAEVSDIHEEDGQTVIIANVPAGKILHYGRELQVMTHGTGIYTAEFIGYRPMSHKDQAAHMKRSADMHFHQLAYK